MNRLPKQEAIQKCLEAERKRLEAFSKETLVEMMLSCEENHLGGLTYAQLANRTAIVTDGRFSCERPDCCDRCNRLKEYCSCKSSENYCPMCDSHNCGCHGC
jgi:hypothetical protein